MENEKEMSELKKLIANQVLEERGYALVWMSAGNSYFKEEVIQKILEFTSSHFRKTIVMAPDEPAEHTFKALGYEGNDISRKARLNANLLQNRAKRTISRFKEKEKFIVEEWTKKIIPNKTYQRELEKVTELYNQNKQFKSDALEATKKVLSGKSKREIDLNKASEEGVYYLLKEIAFVSASPEIFKTLKITYVYHAPWPIYEKFIAGLYDQIKKENLQFLLYR